MNKAKGMKKGLSLEFEKTNSRIMDAKKIAPDKEVSIIFNLDSTKSKITQNNQPAEEVHSDVKPFDLDEAFLDVLDEDKTQKTIVFNKKELEGYTLLEAAKAQAKAEEDEVQTFNPMPIMRSDYTKSEINLEALVNAQSGDSFESSMDTLREDTNNQLVLESHNSVESSHDDFVSSPEGLNLDDDSSEMVLETNEVMDSDNYNESKINDIPNSELTFQENSNSAIDINIEGLGEIANNPLKENENSTDAFVEFKANTNPDFPGLNTELSDSDDESTSLSDVEFSFNQNDQLDEAADVNMKENSTEQDFNESFLKHEKEAFKQKEVSESYGEASNYLSTIRSLREERDSFIDEINVLKASLKHYEQDILGLRANLEESRIEVGILRKRHQSDIEDYKYQFNVLEDKKNRAIEAAKLSEEKRVRLEQRVRIDFNQIKHREKELESKLELLTMDVDAQINSRDHKILELRRKIDSLEFNMENASIREQKTIDDKRKLEDRLNKIMKTLKNSMKTLEEEIDEVSAVNMDKGKN